MLHVDTAIDPVRWLVYLLAGVPLLAWLFFTRQEALRLLALVVALIIVQDNIAGRRWVWAFSIAPSIILIYVALLSQVFQRRLPQLGVFIPLWISLLFFAAVGAISGSIGTGLLAANIDRYQIVFAEGILFFLFGLVAVRRDTDLLAFLRAQATWVGLAVALIHFFTIATGFRFRNALETEQSFYYGGVLGNPNALAAYYVMLIPVALSMLVRQRLSPWIRFVASLSLVAMIGSLVLTGGRSGLLFTVGMCFVALVQSRMGFARGILAIAAASVVAYLGFELMTSLVPDTWMQIFGIAKQEGLETDRFLLNKLYGQMMLEHPFGIGLSAPNFQRLMAKYEIVHAVNSHNLYLDMGLQTGILGLLTFLVMTGIVMARNRRAHALSGDPTQREALFYLFLMLLGYLSNGYFQPIFSVYPRLGNLFWLLCGLSLAASERVFAARRAGSEERHLALRPATFDGPPHAHHV